MPDVTLTLGSSPDRSPLPHPGFPQPAANGSGGRGVGRERKTLTRADWIGTALDAMARDGLRAVAVEPLAERLGATKGSFYWHFRDRNALIEAAAAEWERSDTDVPLAQLDAIADPQERYAATLRWLTGSERNTRIFLVVLWHADHPAIGPVVERILAKRMAFSQRMREDAGRGDEGRDHAEGQWAVVHAYSAWLGLQLLRRAAPGLMPEGGVTEGFFHYAASFGGVLAFEGAEEPSE
ncbi:MAG TPA: TetR/AcrR family transcriptional regulator [Actinocrinis sp.]|nr:TetR/AcrR family transcriptional regulator [Actinocrinis sp.]